MVYPRIAQGQVGSGISVNPEYTTPDMCVFYYVPLASLPEHNTCPLARLVLKRRFEANPLHDNGFFAGTRYPDTTIRQGVEHAVVEDPEQVVPGDAAMYINTRTRRYVDGTAINKNDAIYYVGFGVVPGDFAVAATQHHRHPPVEPAGEVVGVLPPSLQAHLLQVAIRLKYDLVLHDKGAYRYRLVRVNGHFGKNVYAVVGTDFHIPDIVAGDSVYVHAKLDLAAAQYLDLGNPHRLIVAVIYLELPRRRAQLGKNSVETQGIQRKRQPGGRVGQKNLLRATGIEQRCKRYEKKKGQISLHRDGFTFSNAKVIRIWL